MCECFVVSVHVQLQLGLCGSQALGIQLVCAIRSVQYHFAAYLEDCEIWWVSGGCPFSDQCTGSLIKVMINQLETCEMLTRANCLCKQL